MRRAMCNFRLGLDPLGDVVKCHQHPMDGRLLEQVDHAAGQPHVVTTLHPEPDRQQLGVRVLGDGRIQHTTGVGFIVGINEVEDGSADEVAALVLRTLRDDRARPDVITPLRSITVTMSAECCSSSNDCSFIALSCSSARTRPVRSKTR